MSLDLSFDFLEIRNVFGIKGVSIAFPKTGALAITGETGSSKSSIFDSLFLAAFGDPSPARPVDQKDLVRRGMKKGGIRFQFSVNDDAWLVERTWERSTSGRVSQSAVLYRNGEVAAEGPALVTPIVASLFFPRIPAPDPGKEKAFVNRCMESFTATQFIPQGMATALVDSKPMDRWNIYSSAFGINEGDILKISAKQIAERATSRMEDLTRRSELITSGLSGLQQFIENFDIKEAETEHARFIEELSVVRRQVEMEQRVSATQEEMEKSSSCVARIDAELAILLSDIENAVRRNAARILVKAQRAWKMAGDKLLLVGKKKETVGFRNAARAFTVAKKEFDLLRNAFELTTREFDSCASRMSEFKNIESDLSRKYNEVVRSISALTYVDPEWDIRLDRMDGLRVRREKTITTVELLRSKTEKTEESLDVQKKHILAIAWALQGMAGAKAEKAVESGRMVTSTMKSAFVDMLKPLCDSTTGMISLQSIVNMPDKEFVEKFKACGFDDILAQRDVQVRLFQEQKTIFNLIAQKVQESIAVNMDDIDSSSLASVSVKDTTDLDAALRAFSKQKLEYELDMSKYKETILSLQEIEREMAKLSGLSAEEEPRIRAERQAKKRLDAEMSALQQEMQTVRAEATKIEQELQLVRDQRDTTKFVLVNQRNSFEATKEMWSSTIAPLDPGVVETLLAEAVSNPEMEKESDLQAMWDEAALAESEALASVVEAKKNWESVVVDLDASTRDKILDSVISDPHVENEDGLRDRYRFALEKLQEEKTRLSGLQEAFRRFDSELQQMRRVPDPEGRTVALDCLIRDSSASIARYQENVKRFDESRSQLESIKRDSEHLFRVQQYAQSFSKLTEGTEFARFASDYVASLLLEEVNNGLRQYNMPFSIRQHDGELFIVDGAGLESSARGASGGERSVITMLYLREISRRVGGIGHIFLDESLSQLDTEHLEVSVANLMRFSENGLITMITHDPDVADMFPMRIHMSHGTIRQSVGIEAKNLDPEPEIQKARRSRTTKKDVAADMDSPAIKLF